MGVQQYEDLSKDVKKLFKLDEEYQLCYSRCG